MNSTKSSSTNQLSILYILLTASLFSAALLLATATPVYADWTGPTSLGSADNGMKSVASGDVDGDGDLDIVVSNFITTTKIYLNDGTGVMSDAGWTGPLNVNSIALGDVNGDGTLDIVVGRWRQSNQIYFNKGAGQFSTPMTLTGVFSTTSVAIADIDGNGALDIIAGNYLQASIVYTNTGAGNFGITPKALPCVSSCSYKTNDVAVGDVTGEGIPDIVLGNDGQPVVVYQGISTPIEITSSLSISPTSIALGDLNNDRLLDIVVTSNKKGTIYKNNGQGGFGTRMDFTSSNTINDIVLGDINSDGFLDLLVGVAGTGADEYYLNSRNEENPFLGKPTTLSKGEHSGNTTSVVLADLNTDSALDVITGNDGQSSIYLNDQTDAPFQSTFLGNTNSRVKSVALGDIDANGVLDVVASATPTLTLYLNWNPYTHTFTSTVLINLSSSFNSVVFGDVDSNGALDIVAGNDDTLTRYLNWNSVTKTFSSIVSITVPNKITSLALGDVNNDGALDIIMGNQKKNKQSTLSFYLNLPNSVGQFGSPIPIIYQADSDTSFSVNSIAVGDLNDDGALDIITGYDLEPIRVYLHQNDSSQPSNYYNPDNQYTYNIPNSNKATSVTVGDVYGNDGLLDVVAVISGTIRIYSNSLTNKGSFESRPQLTDGDVTGIALGDLNGDGALDIVGTSGKVYFNNGKDGFRTANLHDRGSANSIAGSIAVADMNGDGYWDIVEGNSTGIALHEYMRNIRTGVNILPNNPTRLSVAPLPGTVNANFYASPQVSRGPVISITYKLFDREADPVARLKVEYSLNGGGKWDPASAMSSTQTTNLATSAFPAGTSHVFVWNTQSITLTGQSDNVVLRFTIYPQSPQTVAQGGYRYKNSVAGFYQWPYAAATTFPFRMQRSYVRVLDSENFRPAANALVFGQSNTGTTTQIGGRFATTDLRGFLRDSEPLNAYQRFFAMVPVSATTSISFTNKYTLYHTSGEPTADGLEFEIKKANELQILTVSSKNQLLLLNLDVSLEWGASNDTQYLNQLRDALLRTSQILFDLTNGLAALGEVHVYQAKEKWTEADIQIYARNDLRPNANLGGIVNRPISDTLANKTVIANAMLPGHVRIGATWNRFGTPGITIGEDWPLVLAHEIGHYAFFQLDNYEGLSSGLLKQTDCRGSVMTDAYRQDYSEFLDRKKNYHGFSWNGACLYTLAEVTTGRSDWETIRRFYPFVTNNISVTHAGPNTLPLGVTHIHLPSTSSSENLLPVPFFVNLTDDEGNLLSLRSGEAQAYLLKTHGDGSTEADEIIPLGTPNGSLLQVRGAAIDDRLCIFKNGEQLTSFKCETIQSNTSTLALSDKFGWQPQIQLTPINSTTLAITVTQAVTQSEMYLQILPSFILTAERAITIGRQITAPYIMTKLPGSAIFTQTVQFSRTVLNGYVHLWLPNDSSETVTPFFIAPGWNGNRFTAWDGNRFTAWDGNFSSWDGNFSPWDGNHFTAWDTNVLRTFSANLNSWGAPLSSPDGQVKIFNTENILSGNVATILQPLNALPPSYLTPVGQIYQYRTAVPVTNTLAIEFQYLERELPRVPETDLHIYYSPDGKTWEPQDTHIDPDHNLASAQMRGEGVYALMATIQGPPLYKEWNLVAYPGADLPPFRAFESIGNIYTSIYHWNPVAKPQWRLYDRIVQTTHVEFSSLVNDLTQTKRLETYWIYVLTDTVPYYGAPTPSENQPFQASDLPELPPATFYGWVTTVGDYSPREGDIVKARINNTDCGEGTVVKFSGQLVNVFLPLTMNGPGLEASSASLANSDNTVYSLFLPLLMTESRFAYKVQVRAGDSCGRTDRKIVFTIQDSLQREHVMPNDHVWGNSQACYHPLGVPSNESQQCFTFTAPDLVVESLNATESNVEIVVKNQGTASVPRGNGFWVDLYIAPQASLQPSDIHVNDRWSDLFDKRLVKDGMAWAVSDLALPLLPGASVTLVLHDNYFRPDKSGIAGNQPPNTHILDAGTRIFAQVDSVNTNNPRWGGVLENHEIFGGLYNNVASSVVATSEIIAGNKADNAFSENNPQGSDTEDSFPSRP